MGTPGLAADYTSDQHKHIKDLEQQTLSTLKNYGDSVPPAEEPLYHSLQNATNALVSACAHFRELVDGGNAQGAGTFWSHEGGPLSKAFRRAMKNEVDYRKAAASAYANAGFSRPIPPISLPGAY